MAIATKRRTSASVAAKPTPKLYNVATVSWLHRPYEFSYRWRHYRVTTLPWHDGVTLGYIHDRLKELASAPTSRQTLEEMYALVSDAIEILWRLTKKRWWHRKNPFDDVTLGELFCLLDFFAESLMMLPSLRLLSQQGRMNPKGFPWTSRTRSRSLPDSIRRGSA